MADQEQQEQELHDVWSILLEAPPMLDQRVVCRLLCCSQDMSRLVHAKCAGKLHLEVGSSDNAPGSHSLGSSISSWLSCSARLLHSLKVLGPTPSEADITSGLTAAAANAAATATLDALQLTDCPQRSNNSSGGLPLQDLFYPFRCNGSIFSGLAGAARQLTGLTLALDLSDPAAGCGDALGALTSLRTLTLGVCSLSSRDFNSTGNFGAVGAAMQRLTQLTSLNVDPSVKDMCSAGPAQVYVPCLEALGCVEALPPSLKCLQMSRRECMMRHMYGGSVDAMNLEHLTCLSELQLRRMSLGTVLPAGLKRLRLLECNSVEPIVPDKLQHLEELDIVGFDAEATATASDTRKLSDVIIGFQGRLHFRELHLGMCAMSEDAVPLRLFRALAEVPLVELRIVAVYCLSEEFVFNLGLLTQLTSLSLSSLGWKGPVVKQLAAGLQQRTVLQQLNLLDTACGAVGLGVESGAATLADWGSICQAVVALRGLRSVSIHWCGLEDAAARLAGATHLTHLTLNHCALGCSCKEALADGLQHLVPEHLEIE